MKSTLASSRVILLALTIATPITTRAVDIDWCLVPNDDFINATAWCGAVVPGVSDSAIFNVGGTCPADFDTAVRLPGAVWQFASALTRLGRCMRTRLPLNE